MRDVRMITVLLQLLVLVKSAQLFSRLAVMSDQCSRDDARHGEIACTPLFGLFGVQSTFGVITYLCLTLVQIVGCSRDSRRRLWLPDVALDTPAESMVSLSGVRTTRRPTDRRVALRWPLPAVRAFGKTSGVTVSCA